VAAFLDFRKAYDTVSREFLFAVMEAVGAGEGLRRWAGTLLSDTAAAAVVNGYTSEPVAYAEGVRQGCPLAPLLYLFPAWALACWLKECPAVGVEVAPGQVVHAAQYADDTEPLLGALSQPSVEQFKGHMAVFRRASGQELNVGKSFLLPVGALEAWEPRPAEVAGLRVVREASALGMVFGNGGDAASAVAWEARVEAVLNRYSKLARLGLSVFGRAQTAGAYGLGRLLYHAEHAGLPCEVAERLQRATVALVDRGLAPASGERRLPGVPSELLAGKARRGGFGMLPLQQHVLARHAALARQLVLWATGGPVVPSGPGGAQGHVPQPLWVQPALYLLSRLCPAVHPALGLLGAAAVGGREVEGRLPGPMVGRSVGPELPAGPLRRMVAGLRALGPAREVASGSLQLRPGVLQLPLWGNPLLQLECRADQRTVRWPLDALGPAPPTADRRAWQRWWQRSRWRGEQQYGFGSWVGTPGLFTVGDLRRLACSVGRLHRQGGVAVQPGGLGSAGAGRRRLAVAAVWGQEYGVRLPPVVDQLFGQWSPTCRPEDSQLLLAVQAMYAALPEAWQEAARLEDPRGDGHLAADQRQLDVGAADGAARAVVERLGWPGVSLSRHMVGPAGQDLWPLTVRAGTRLQLCPILRAQREARRALAVDALVGVGQPSPAAGEVEAAVDGLEGGMRALWDLPWENRSKEALWRLAVNGVPGAGGHGLSLAGPCPCGWQGPQAGLGGDVEEQRGAREWREHHFWGCPVARAVVGQLEAALPGQQVPCAAVWLLRPPQGVCACVWEAVCAASVEAMWFGRRLLWALHKEQPPRDPSQRLITEFFPVVERDRGDGGAEGGSLGGSSPSGSVGNVSASPTERAGRKAAARFWELLQDLAVLGLPKKDVRWKDVPEGHPFLEVRQQSLLAVNLPETIPVAEAGGSRV
jgi:hypothetical protein